LTLAVSATLGAMLGQTAEAKNIKVDKVARGQARFDTRGNTTRITVSDRAIINYSKFDIPRQNVVKFVQPSAQSKVLNRINGAEPSKIDGTLTANGIVYLVNPAGVMFGSNSIINVGQLYAAAGKISDEDFVKGTNQFTGVSGVVANGGRIEADAVTLVGRHVVNNGVVLGKNSVTMVAGEDVLVGEKDGNVFAKVGTVKEMTEAPAAPAAGGARPAIPWGSGDAFSVAANFGKVKSKQVTVQSNGVTTVAGKVDASAAGAGEKGGSVKVLGEKVVVAGATIDASGAAGGGTVLVGGDYQGQGDTPRAQRTLVSGGSTIKADATGSGDGGKVVVWADGVTWFFGSISAKGGPAGGNGGVVEVSGKQTLRFEGHVDTTAAKGATGSLLLDPDEIKLVTGTGTEDGELNAGVGTVGVLLGEIDAADTGAVFEIGKGALEALTGTTNVKLQAKDKISAGAAMSLDFQLAAAGTVTMQTTSSAVNGDIDLSNVDLSTLGSKVTLDAARDLKVKTINTAAGATTDGGDVSLKAGRAVTASGEIKTAGSAKGGKVDVDAVGAVSLNKVTTAIAASPTDSGAVTVKGGGAGVTLGDKIDAGGKDVTVTVTAGDLALGSIKGNNVTADVQAGGLLTPNASDNHVQAGAAVTVTTFAGHGVGTDKDHPLNVDAGGAVTITSGADLHVNVQTAGDADITDSTAGNVKFTRGGQNYNLTYGAADDLTLGVNGNLTDGSAAGNAIKADVLTIRAAGAIGAGAVAPVKVDSNLVNARANGGGLAIEDPAGAMAIGAVQASGDVSVVAKAGDITLGTITGAKVTVDAQAGKIDTPNSAETHVTAGGDVLLKGTTSIGRDSSKPLNLDAAAGVTIVAGTDLHLNVLAAGDATITNSGAGSVKFTRGGQTHDLTFGAGNDLTLGVKGSLKDTSGAGNALKGNVLTLRSATGAIGDGAGAPVKVDANHVNVTTGSGGVAIRDSAGGLELGAVDASGEVSVVSDQGDLTLTGKVKGANVTLSTGRHVINNAGAADRVEGAAVKITAGADAAETNGRIGTALKPVLTTANTLELTAKGNDVNDSAIRVKEKNAVTVTNATSGQGTVSVELEEAGDLTVGNVKSGSVVLRTFDGLIVEGAGGKVQSDGAASTVVIEAKGANKDVGTTGNSLDIDAKGSSVAVKTETGGSVYLHTLTNDALEVVAPGAGVTSSLATATTTYDLTYQKNLTIDATGAIKNTADKTISAPAGLLRLTSTNGGIGESGKAVRTDADAISARTSGGGGIFLREKDAAKLEGIQTTNQGIEITNDAGSLTLNQDVDAGTANATIAAAKHIVGSATAKVSGTALTLKGGVVEAGGGVGDVDSPATPTALRVQATSVAPSSAGGLINIVHVGGTGGGGATDTFDVVDAKAGSGNIIITTPVTMRVAGVETTGDVTLTSSGGAIVDLNKDALVDVKGNKITLSAASGVGVREGAPSFNDRLELKGKTLDVQTGTGGILARNVADATLSPTAVSLNVSTLRAIDFVQDGDAALTLKKAQTANGNVSVENVDRGITLDGAVTAGSGNDVVIKAGQAVEATATAPEVSGNDVTIIAGTAGGGGDFGIGTTADRVKTNADTLTLTAAGAGDIFVNESDAVRLDTNNAPTYTGNVVVQITGAGDLTVGAVKTGTVAPAGKGRVALKAGGGKIIDGQDTVANVESKELSLDATNLVGDAGGTFDTKVSAVAVKTTGGGVYLENESAGLSVTDVAGVGGANVSGISSGNTPIELTQNVGNLTVDRAIDAGSSYVKIDLTAAGALLTNNSTITGTGTGSGIEGVTLIADRMALGAAPGQAVNAGGQLLVLRTHAADRAIKFGVEDAGALSLDQDELNTLGSSERVIIGHAAAGDVTFLNGAAYDLPGATVLSIVTRGSINGNAGGNAVLKSEELSLEAKTGIGAGQRLVLDVPKLAAKTPDGNIDIRNVRKLDVTTVAGVTGVSAGDYDVTPAVVGDDVRLQADNGLIVSQPMLAGGKIDIISGENVDVLANVTSGAGKTGPFNEALLFESITVNATGNVTVEQPVTALKGVTVTAGGDATFHDRVSGLHGNVEVTSANVASGAHATLPTAGHLTAKYDVVLKATTGKVDLGGDVTAGWDFEAGPPAALTSPTGKIDARAITDILTSGNLLAKTSIDLNAGQDISLTNTVRAVDQYVKGTAGRNIETKIEGTIVAGTNVELEATGGNVEIGRSVTAGNPADGHIHLVAGGDVHTGPDTDPDPGRDTAGHLTATREITAVAGQNVTTEGKVDAGTFVELTAKGGDVFVKNAVNGRDGYVHLTTGVLPATGGDVKSTAAGTIDAKTDVTVIADRNVDLDGTVDAGTLVDVHAKGGLVSLDGAVTAKNEHIKAKADAGDVSNSQTLGAKSHVELDASNDVNVGAGVTATDDYISALAGGSVNVDGTLDAGSSITLNATSGNVEVRQRSTAHGTFIEATAGRSVTTSGAGTLDAGSHVALVAKDGDVSLGARATAAGDYIDATASRLVSGSGSVLTTAAGELVAKKHVRLTANDGNVDLKAKVTANDGDGSTADDFIEASAKGSVLTDAAAELFAGQYVKLDATSGDVTTAGKITADRGYVQATAGGAVTTSGAIKAGQQIDLTANGTDVTVEARAEAGDFVHATAERSVRNTGEIEAGTNVELLAKNGDVNVDAQVTAGDYILAQAPHGDVVTTAGLGAGSSITLEAGHDVDVGALATAGTFIDATAGNSVTTGSAGVLDAGTHIALWAQGGNVLVGAKATAGDFIHATAFGSVTSTAAGELDAGTNIELLAQNGDVNVGALAKAGDYIHATAAGSVTNTGPLDAGSHVALLANGGDVNVNSPVVAHSDYILAQAPSGNVITTATLGAGSSITLRAGGNVDVGATATAGSFILAEAGANVITSGELHAGTSITLDAGNDISIGNLAQAGTFIHGLAGHDITSDGELRAGDYILLEAGANVTINQLAQAGSSITAKATSGDVTTNGPLVAGTDVLLDAGTSVLVNNTINAGGNVDAVAGVDITSTAAGDVTAGGHVDFNAGHDVHTDGDALANGSYLTFKAGHDVFGSGVLHANTVLTLDAANDVLFTGRSTSGGDTIFKGGHDVTVAPGASVAAGGSVFFLAGNDVNSAGSVRATLSVTFDAGHDVITDGSVDAGSFVLFNAGNDISSASTVNGGTDVTFTAGSDITSDNSVRAGQSIKMTASGGDIRTTLRGTMDAGTFVRLTAPNGLIDLNADVTAGQQIEATAGGDITTSIAADLLAGTSVTLDSGGSIRTAGTIGAGTDILATAASDIETTGDWTAGSNVTATAGNDILVRAKIQYGNTGTFTAARDVAFRDGGSLVKLGSSGQTLVTATNGDVTMEAGTQIDGGGATVGITAGSDIQLSLVKTTFNAADTAAVTLRAGSGGISDLHTFNEGSGAVSDASVIATGGGLDAQAGTSIDLGTRVAWVEAQTLGAGALTLHEVDAIDVRRVISANGLVTLRSGNTMNVGQVVAGGDNDASLRTYAGNIDFNALPGDGSVTAAGDTVFLTAAGSIVGNTDAHNVVANRLENIAGGSIVLGTEVGTIKSSSVGDTTLRSFIDVELEEVVTSAGDIDVRSDSSMGVRLVRAGTAGDRDVKLTAVGGNIIRVPDDRTGVNVLAGDLTAAAENGLIRLNTRVATLDSTSGGDTSIFESDGIQLTRMVSRGGDILVEAGGDIGVRSVTGPTDDAGPEHTITLTSGGDILGIDTGRHVAGDSLLLDAAGTINLNTAVNELTSVSGGDATFDELDNLRVQTLTAVGSATVKLTAGGAVTDGNGRRKVNVTAGTLDIDALSINLDTEIDHLRLKARSGDAAIRERTEVDVDVLDFGGNASGSLFLSGGRLVMKLPDNQVVTGGDQTYRGVMELAGSGSLFTLQGRNINIDAVVEGGAHQLKVLAGGQTTVTQNITANAGIDFVGPKTVVNGPVTLTTAGRAVNFVPSAAAGSGATVLDGEGVLKIVTKGGAVMVDGQITGKRDGDGRVTGGLDLDVNTRRDGGRRRHGNFEVTGASAVDQMRVVAGDIELRQVDAARDIELVQDGRLFKTFAKPTEANTAAAANGQETPFVYTRGLITLHGNLTAGGDIVLGETPKAKGKGLPGLPLGATGGDPAVPNVATIVVVGDDFDPAAANGPGDMREFTISGNTFAMRPLEKMTVMGNLTVKTGRTTPQSGVGSDVASATLSDISALGTLTVVSDSVAFARRNAGLLLTNNGVIGNKADAGVDFYANDGIYFFHHGTSGEPRVINPDNLALNDLASFGVGPTESNVGNLGFRWRRNTERSGVDKFQYVRPAGPNPNKGPTVVFLDATPEGPSSTDISVTLTQALPQEMPTPTEETNLSLVKLKQLEALGIYGRPLEDKEKVDKAMGLVLYLDVLPQRGHIVKPRANDWTVVIGKLPRESTYPLLALDDELYGPDDASKTEEHRREVQDEARVELLKALSEFPGSREEGKFVMAEFVKFLRDGNYPKAERYLEIVGDMLNRLDHLGLTDPQKNICRVLLLSGVSDENEIASDELEKVARTMGRERKDRVAARLGGAQARR
jgi:filamentous hemagglutinin family protein